MRMSLGHDSFSLAFDVGFMDCFFESLEIKEGH